MRVRSNRKSSDTRHRAGLARGRALLRERPAEPAVDEEVAAEEDDLADERRLRAAGGPHDRARYTCGCGYVWWTDVSASVVCPHCGSAQAW
jgi:hypothetical protein